MSWFCAALALAGATLVAGLASIATGHREVIVRYIKTNPQTGTCPATCRIPVSSRIRSASSRSSIHRASPNKGSSVPFLQDPSFIGPAPSFMKSGDCITTISFIRAAAAAMG
jgi:hypothetical protein